MCNNSILTSILGGTVIVPILQMRELSLTEVGKLFQVHTVNEFGFKPLLLTVMLCGPLALCDSHLNRLWIWKTLYGEKYGVGGRGKTVLCVLRVSDEGLLLLT